MNEQESVGWLMLGIFLIGFTLGVLVGTYWKKANSNEEK